MSLRSLFFLLLALSLAGCAPGLTGSAPFGGTASPSASGDDDDTAGDDDDDAVGDDDDDSWGDDDDSWGDDDDDTWTTQQPEVAVFGVTLDVPTGPDGQGDMATGEVQVSYLADYDSQEVICTETAGFRADVLVGEGIVEGCTHCTALIELRPQSIEFSPGSCDPDELEWWGSPLQPLLTRPNQGGWGDLLRMGMVDSETGVERDLPLFPDYDMDFADLAEQLQDYGVWLSHVSYADGSNESSLTGMGYFDGWAAPEDEGSRWFPWLYWYRWDDAPPEPEPEPDPGPGAMAGSYAGQALFYWPLQ